MSAPVGTSSRPEQLEGRALRSSILSAAGFSHAFFTRNGGISEGPFRSLNVGSNLGDPKENVVENLERAGALLDVPGHRIYFLSQVHGAEAVELRGGEDRARVLLEHGDIVVTRAAGHAAAIRTADCVPVLLGCSDTGWVAACHAGWRGCLVDAAGAAARALLARGASRLFAAIGPHISLSAFEVSEDVAADLWRASPNKSIINSTFGVKPHVDLRLMVRSQLLVAGLADHDIDDVFGCTHNEPERFFSFRRDKNPSGRLLSAIVAP